MQIKFKALNLTNFKSHEDLEVKFGDLTKILADNAKGKSSIGEAITFLLYGNDLMGSKLDPSPVTYKADNTLVTLLLNVDGKDVLLGRGIDKGRNKFYVNEVPSKATEFNEVVEKLFDKDLFLSLFNPNYFFTLHWEKQREMILKYTTAPANKEVFKELPKPQAEKLSALVKKHSLEQLDKIHRENKTKQDKQYIAAQSRTKTLKEQLDQQAPTVPLESLQAELSTLVKERNEIEQSIEGQQELNGKISSLQGKINTLTIERDDLAEQYKGIKNEQVEEACRLCKQPLQEASILAVNNEKEDRMESVRVMHTKSVEIRKALETELEGLEHINIAEQLSKSWTLGEKINSIKNDVGKHSQLEAMQNQVDEALKAEKETLESLNDSIFIIDAIKDFHIKEAELQADKVQGLFENLSIKLFETVKTTGEMKPTFVVQMDGKDYLKLSLSESIRAGLELRDVLSQQSEIIAPCFVDNAESITKFKEPNGQLILARVVAGQELTIETEEI